MLLNILFSSPATAKTFEINPDLEQGSNPATSKENNVYMVPDDERVYKRDDENDPVDSDCEDHISNEDCIELKVKIILQ